MPPEPEPEPTGTEPAGPEPTGAATPPERTGEAAGTGRAGWAGRAGGTPARRVLWGGAIAVACTAAMVAITVPLQAMGDDSSGSPSPSGSATSAAGSNAGTPPPGVVEDPGPVGEKGSGRDPLTPDEVKRARTLAVDDAFRAKSKDVQGKPGPEYLRTELADRAPGAAAGPRSADVYFFNYQDGTTVKRVVDLDSGKVLRSSSAKDIQPPPSERETQEALKLLLKSSASKRLKTNFQDATDRRLARPGQLNATGMSYRKVGAGAVDKCVSHRCVSLFTRVGGDGPWIDVTDVVVDLSDRTVSRTQ